VRKFASGPPVVFLATLAVCILLHETGHIIAALLTGGNITQIAFLSLTPHVTVLASRFASVEAFRAATGSGLVILTTMTVLYAFRRRSTIVVEAMGWFALIELAGWSLSILSPDGSANDASYFLLQSHTRAMYVIAVVAILACAIALLLRVQEPQYAGRFPSDSSLQK
jgi:hypothetical protein